MVSRGEVWWAEMPVPGYRRPILVVQSDPFNASRLRTVMAAVITSNLRLADAPGNVLLASRLSGLPKDSVINVSQVVTLDRAFLVEAVATLPPAVMAAVDSGLRLALGL